MGAKASTKLGGMSNWHGGVAKPDEDTPRSPRVLSPSSRGDFMATLASSSHRPRAESCFRSCWLFRSAPSAMVSTSSFGSLSSRGLDVGDGTADCTGDARARSLARGGDCRRGVRQASGTKSCTSATIDGGHVGAEAGGTGCARNTGTPASGCARNTGTGALRWGAKSVKSSVLQPALACGNRGVEHLLVTLGPCTSSRTTEVSAHAVDGGSEPCRLLALSGRGGDFLRRLCREVQACEGEPARAGTHGG